MGPKKDMVQSRQKNYGLQGPKGPKGREAQRMVDPGEPLSECNLDHELAYVGLPCPDVYIGLYHIGTFPPSSRKKFCIW